jgi:glucokinase
LKTEDSVNLAEKYWIGFDLGGTKMLAAALNPSFNVVASKRKKTRGEQNHVTLERIENLIRKMLEENEIDSSRIAGIGIGCPGPVEWQTGVVRVAVNLGWKDVGVGKYLEDRFACPVAVLNDVDAGVYGEYRFGAGRGSRTALGIFPGTGIGGGCVYDGQILRGKHLTCMEIGHVMITGSPRPGPTGMTGTLESEASRLAIAAEIAKLAYRGEAPSVLRGPGTDLAKLRSKAIAEAIKSGEKAVQEVLENAAHLIGYAVANMVHLIGPDCIILGGGLVEAMPELFLREVTKTAQRSVLACYADTFRVRCAELGDNAAVMGAAGWVAKHVGS